MSRTLPWWSRVNPGRCDSCIGGDAVASLPERLAVVESADVGVDMARPWGLIRCRVIVTLPGTRGSARKASLEGWYGKIIGAILGYIIGRGLLGAIVGFVIGHQFDVMARRNRGTLGGRRPGAIGGRHGSPAEMRLAFFEATFQ